MLPNGRLGLGRPLGRANSTAFRRCSTGSSAPRAADVTLDCGIYSSAWLQASLHASMDERSVWCTRRRMRHAPSALLALFVEGRFQTWRTLI